MSSEETSNEDTTNPVEAQESSVEVIKTPRPDHKCCEHCKPDAHAPHTLGCPDTNGHKLSDAELEAAIKDAVDDMFAVSEVWKPKMVVKFKLECPSGQNVLVKHMDILDLAAADLVEDMDTFSKKLFPSRFDDQGNPVDEDEKSGSIWKTLKDPEKRLKFLDMTNRLMEIGAVRPRIINDGVALVTDPETGRKETTFGYRMTMDEQLEHLKKPVETLTDPRNQAYAGSIGFADRMAFFVELNKPLGMIEPFRAESAIVLEGMESGERVGSTSE